MLNILTIQRSKLDKIAEYYKVIRLPSCDDNDEAKKEKFLYAYLYIYLKSLLLILLLSYL